MLASYYYVDPSDLVNFYSGFPGAIGVDDVFAFSSGAPYFGGDTLEILIQTSRRYPLVTIATMLINTNDGFTAINGLNLNPDDICNSIVTVPAYDAGTEENNELCASIPGPACDASSGNVASGNGEGFVFVHRGFFGIGDELLQSGYDWRNPVMMVEVSEAA